MAVVVDAVTEVVVVVPVVVVLLVVVVVVVVVVVAVVDDALVEVVVQPPASAADELSHSSHSKSEVAVAGTATNSPGTHRVRGLHTRSSLPGVGGVDSHSVGGHFELDLHWTLAVVVPASATNSRWLHSPCAVHSANEWLGSARYVPAAQSVQTLSVGCRNSPAPHSTRVVVVAVAVVAVTVVAVTVVAVVVVVVEVELVLVTVVAVTVVAVVVVDVVRLAAVIASASASETAFPSITTKAVICPLK